jgi:hypothetical protein
VLRRRGGVALIKRAQPLRDKAFQIKQRQVEATGGRELE